MKILRVNMTTQHIRTEEIPSQYKGLGGRALTAAIIHHEAPWDCLPLGPENRLVFAPGYLTGTPLVNTGRLSIGQKVLSPRA
jgi:aldehyde:ferredoxin oxidoreductase